MEFLIPIILLLILVWLLVARPQRRRQVAQLAMQDGLEPGDEVVTAGGMHGVVRLAEGDVLTIEIAAGTDVRVDRRAIAARVEAAESSDEESGEVTENRPPDG